ncbi:hypothetical protein SCACP_30150 [Sporomusa carbonis]|uniref:phage tail tape measure protein n=1 Tax=Sporomusa carbonis TaxID=3076075 RepID=UPI003A71B3B7
MSVSFSVAMVLTAFNRMSPGIREAVRDVQNLKQTVSSASNMTISMRVKKTEEVVREYKDKADHLRTNGVEQAATGMAVLAPVENAVKNFAQVEDSLMNLRIAAYDASVPIEQYEAELKKAQIEAERLGDVTRFSTREAYNGFTVLSKGGASLQDIYSGLGQAAVYLAQAGEVPIEKSAEAMIKISNAYQLTGTQMKDVADMINRVDGASTASIDSLQEGFKYASGTAAQLKQSVNETAQALAVLNNRGLDGSTAGTNYADFLQRLIPMTKKQTEEMAKLGMVKVGDSTITAEQYSTMKQMKWLTDNGHSVFFDDQGRLKQMSEVIQIMRDSFKDMRPDDVQKAMHKIFGEQGGRAAYALYQDGKGSWEEVGTNIAKAMGLEQKIGLKQTTLLGRAENMMGSLENLSATSGSPIGQFISSQLDGLTAIINKMRQLSNEYPGVTKGIMWLVTWLGLFKLSLGGFSILRSILLSIGADFLSVFKWILKFGGGVQNLKVGFDLIRATGAGFWRSLWQGAQLAWPWLARLVGWAGTAGGFLLRLGSYGLRFGSMLGGGAMTAIRWLGLVLSWIGRLVGGWMVAAVRIAAGWLIAMGPVGWIIAGVTAIIAAAIWAWNTNFMGFRDKCIQVWNAISSWAQRTWSNIVGFVQTAIGWIGGFIDKIKAALGLSRSLPSELPKIRGVDLDPKDFKPFGPENTPVVPQGGGRNYYFNITNNNDISASDPESAGESVVKLSVPNKYKASLDPSFG